MGSPHVCYRHAGHRSVVLHVRHHAHLGAYGVKVFNWAATMWRGSMTFEAPMVWAVGFIFVFTMGLHRPDLFHGAHRHPDSRHTYYVVAHFHYVLVAGSLFALFAGFYYWAPKWTGVMIPEWKGQLHFWWSLIAFNVTFFPCTSWVWQACPAAYADYPMQFADFNALASVGAFGFWLCSGVLHFRGADSRHAWQGPACTSCTLGRERKGWNGKCLPAPFHTFETHPSSMQRPPR